MEQIFLSAHALSTLKAAPWGPAVHGLWAFLTVGAHSVHAQDKPEVLES